MKLSSREDVESVSLGNPMMELVYNIEAYGSGSNSCMLHRSKYEDANGYSLV